MEIKEGDYIISTKYPELKGIVKRNKKGHTYTKHYGDKPITDFLVLYQKDKFGKSYGIPIDDNNIEYFRFGVYISDKLQ